MIHLRQAGPKFATARAWACDNNQGMCCFDVVVSTVPFIANNRIDIGRVSLGETVGVDLDIASFQFVLKNIDSWLVFKASDNHGSDVDSPTAQIINLSHDINVVGDPEVCSHLPTFDVACIDTQDDVCVSFELLQ